MTKITIQVECDVKHSAQDKKDMITALRKCKATCNCCTIKIIRER